MIEETLLKYAARERHNDPWWEDVYQTLESLDRKVKALPAVSENKVEHSGHTCHNCGLPQDAEGRAGVWMRLPVRAENNLQQDSYTKAWFHCLNCAIQSLYLTLDTKSGRETITRSLDGEVVSLADFQSWLGKAIRYEMVFETIENKGLKNAIFDLKPYRVDSSKTLRNSPSNSNVGRPAKFTSPAARQKAYRERRKASTLEPVEVGR